MQDLEQLEEQASRAYRAFCDSACPYLPSLYVPDWSLLPEVLKLAWKAAVRAVISTL
jgi:hypothetical protein